VNHNFIAVFGMDGFSRLEENMRRKKKFKEKIVM
jgi:hypothetical protein